MVHWADYGFDISFDLAYAEAVTYGPFVYTIVSGNGSPIRLIQHVRVAAAGRLME